MTNRSADQSGGVTQVLAAIPFTPTRLAEWADRRILPALVVVLVGADAGLGLNWLLSPPADLRSPAYDVAKIVMPMAMWGSVLLILTAAAAGALWSAGRSFVSFYLLGPALGGLWLVWSVFFTMGTWGLDDGASGFNSIVAVTLFLLHFLAALVIAKRAGVPLSPAGR